MFLRDETWVPAGLERAELRTRWARLLAELGEAQGRALEPVETRRRLAAYVNHGRWVADCPECRGGIAAHPDYAEGVCPDCGRIYTLRFPSAAEADEAAELLRTRHLRRRNWRPEAESPDFLRAENTLLQGVL